LGLAPDRRANRCGEATRTKVGCMAAPRDRGYGRHQLGGTPRHQCEASVGQSLCEIFLVVIDCLGVASEAREDDRRVTCPKSAENASDPSMADHHIRTLDLPDELGEGQVWDSTGGRRRSTGTVLDV
jgi:hypothetical protein